MSAPTRRGFLSGLASIPLIGGGFTLIGRATMAPIPLTQVAAAPLLSDPRERARYAWEAFSTAMREITADAHGWSVQGGDRAPFRGIPGGPWLETRKIDYVTGAEPRCPALIADRWNKIDLNNGDA